MKGFTLARTRSGDRIGPTEYRTLGTYSHDHVESGAPDAFIENL